MDKKRKEVVAVHGGAWDIPENLWDDSLLGVKNSAIAGYKALLRGGTAVDAVVAAVKNMEENPVFDAGRGSVLNCEGGVEVAALIMRGDSLRAGAIAAAKNILTPIVVAERVMEDTQHVLIAGEGANKFASSIGIQEHPIEDLLTEEGKRQLQKYRKYKTAVNSLFNKPQGHDTVGCVALDSNGLTCCGTSTGGITGQLPGRVGDTPIIGCGGYADDAVGAVSTTGHGESICKVGLAHLVMNGLREGNTADVSGKKALSSMLDRVGGRGGCVILTREGEVGAPRTTARMPWAFVREGEVHWGMNEGQHFTASLQ